MKLIFATHNPGKVIEMRKLLADLDFDVMSADEAGVTEDVVEDGKTFEENSLKKARFVAQKSGEWAVADDTGICIESLDNQPGIRSARWAGEGVTDQQLIDFTLAQITSENRRAYFESCISLVAPDGREFTFIGKLHGRVALEPTGIPRPKLPYDQIFIPEGQDRTFAEMSLEEKNSLSHRGIAFRKLKEFLKTL